MKAKLKGYRVERKVRKIFEKFGWKVIRSGASLGPADLVCLKGGKCLLIQIKSTKKKAIYYSDYLGEKLEGFPFYVIVNFERKGMKVCKPKKKISLEDGIDLYQFLEKINEEYAAS